MAALFGIWHVSKDGKVTLCESDESMSVYYDCAFSVESHAVAFAAKLTQDSRRHGFESVYLAKPLPDGCIAQWVEG